jgi:hypothetical protein
MWSTDKPPSPPPKKISIKFSPNLYFNDPPPPPPDTKCNQTPPSNFKAVGCCGQTYWWTGTVFHICFYVVQWKRERLTTKTPSPPLCESHAPFSDLMRTVDLDRDYKNTKLSFQTICLIRAWSVLLPADLQKYWGQYIEKIERKEGLGNPHCVCYEVGWNVSWCVIILLKNKQRFWILSGFDGSFVAVVVW